MGRRRILVVGLGSSGRAAARLAAVEGAEVWATDRRFADELGPGAMELPVKRLELGGHPQDLLDGVAEVVVSPGVDPTIQLVRAARARGLAVTPEVEFAWRRRREAPLVAVTGSNGKSTVTVLVREMLVAGGVAAVAGGNLGPPASELVLDGGWDAWVLEMSSFQTELLGDMRPRAAVLLNLSQDHLERHADMAAYAAAKHRLLAFQTADDVAVLNADDPFSDGAPGAARRRRFSVAGPADARLEGDRLVLDGAPLASRDELRLAGLHNVANALAAALAADALGTPRRAVREALAGFDGLPHRHRVVARSGGVTFVDDSKATNVGATAAALAGYPPGSVHLILGGLAKGQDFGQLGPEVERAAVRVYLIGRDAEAIATALEGRVAAERCGTLEAAVRRARHEAEPGQWVLLAPACASFDQFSGYAERGEAFAHLAREEVAPCP